MQNKEDIIWLTSQILSNVRNTKGKYLTPGGIITLQTIYLLSTEDPKKIYIDRPILAKWLHCDVRQINNYLLELENFKFIKRSKGTVALKDKKITSALLVELTLPDELPIPKSDFLDTIALKIYKFLLKLYFTESKYIMRDWVVLSYPLCCELCKCNKNILILSLRKLSSLDLIGLHETEDAVLISLMKNYAFYNELETFILSSNSAEQAALMRTAAAF